MKVNCTGNMIMHALVIQRIKCWTKVISEIAISTFFFDIVFIKCISKS